MLVAGPAQAAEPTGQELVAHVERLLWGKTNQGSAEMTVITPRWERKIEIVFLHPEGKWVLSGATVEHRIASCLEAG